MDKSFNEAIDQLISQNDDSNDIASLRERIKSHGLDPDSVIRELTGELIAHHDDARDLLAKAVRTGSSPAYEALMADRIFVVTMSMLIDHAMNDLNFKDVGDVTMFTTAIISTVLAFQQEQRSK